MPITLLRAHLKRLPSLQAEQQLRQAAVAAYPHMEQSDARRLWANWQRAAYPDQAVVRPSPAMLALVGIGVTVVKADKHV